MPGPREGREPELAQRHLLRQHEGAARLELDHEHPLGEPRVDVVGVELIDLQHEFFECAVNGVAELELFGVLHFAAVTVIG